MYTVNELVYIMYAYVYYIIQSNDQLRIQSCPSRISIVALEDLHRCICHTLQIQVSRKRENPAREPSGSNGILFLQYVECFRKFGNLPVVKHVRIVSSHNYTGSSLKISPIAYLHKYNTIILLKFIIVYYLYICYFVRKRPFSVQRAVKWKSPKCRAEKRKSPKVPGGKEEIPKSAGRRARRYPLHNQKLKCKPTTVSYEYLIFLVNGVALITTL
ncbi:hypothetical protein AGLY_007162 [Aphis glycines]|uniref:Uncharacterized protein n=1 Tax=Aphis glycines TaxID=307491 RepID=A0A6G0TNV0_APHGL|nr:hypothetical protein AGLY_007162 [Aphis glycines]